MMNKNSHDSWTNWNVSTDGCYRNGTENKLHKKQIEKLQKPIRNQIDCADEFFFSNNFCFVFHWKQSYRLNMRTTLSKLFLLSKCKMAAVVSLFLSCRIEYFLYWHWWNDLLVRWMREYQKNRQSNGIVGNLGIKLFKTFNQFILSIDVDPSLLNIRFGSRVISNYMEIFLQLVKCKKWKWILNKIAGSSHFFTLIAWHDMQ